MSERASRAGGRGWALMFAGLTACSGQIGARSKGAPTPDAGAASDAGALYDASADAADGADAIAPIPPTPCSPSKAIAPRPPADDRCGLTPRLIVTRAAVIPTTPSGTVAAIGPIVPSPAGLYIGTSFANTTHGAAVDGSLMRVPFAGGIPTLIASGQLFRNPVLTATDAIFTVTQVPRGNGDGILSVPLSGGPPTVIFAPGNAYSIGNGFATDGSFVYFAYEGALGLPIAAALPLGQDAGNGGVITLWSGVSPIDILGAFGQRLIFGTAQGAVGSLPLPPRANGTSTSLGSCPAGPLSLKPCGSNACWVVGNDTVEQLDLSGGAPRALATFDSGLADFDDSNAYLIVDDGLDRVAVERAPLDGSCPIVLASMPNDASVGALVDDECIYWINAQGIYSLALTSNGGFQQ